MKLLTIPILTTIFIQARIIHSVDISLMPVVCPAHCAQLKGILNPCLHEAQFSREPDSKHIIYELILKFNHDQYFEAKTVDV